MCVSFYYHHIIGGERWYNLQPSSCLCKRILRVLSPALTPSSPLWAPPAWPSLALTPRTAVTRCFCCSKAFLGVKASCCTYVRLSGTLASCFGPWLTEARSAPAAPTGTCIQSTTSWLLCWPLLCLLPWLYCCGSWQLHAFPVSASLRLWPLSLSRLLLVAATYLLAFAASLCGHRRTCWPPPIQSTTS